jgi:hypothetical protein
MRSNARLSLRSIPLLAALAVLVLAAPAGAATYSNPAAISIPGTAGSAGNAQPYPSTIAVAGAVGTVRKATVTFKGFAHQCSIDNDILLVGPQGQSAILMSDAGDCDNEVGLRPGIDLTFDDAAARSVPCLDKNSTPTQLPGGTYAPTDYSPPANHVQSACDPDSDLDHHEPPPVGQPGPLATSFSGVNKPVGGWGHSLAAFNNSDPNGTWSLYITDQYAQSTGKIAGGWILNLTTSTSPIPAPGPTNTPTPPPNIAAKFDTKGLKLKQKVLRKGGVVVTFTSSVDGNIALSGTVKLGKTYKFKPVKTHVVAGRRTTVTLKLPKAGLTAVKKALAARKKPKAKITLAQSIASGIKTSLTRNVTLIR